VEITPARLESSDLMRAKAPAAPQPAPAWFSAPTRELVWTLPLPGLVKAARGVGCVNLPPDPDAIFRRATPMRPVDNGRVYPHLAVLAAAVKLGVPLGKIRADATAVRIGNRLTIPVSPDGTLLIDFAGPPLR